MSYTAKTVMFFGLYMLGQGIVLITYPNILLGLFHLPLANEVWVRVVGLALLILSYYYIRCALLDLRVFFELTVHGRTIQLILFILLVLSKQAEPVLLVFAGFEFLTGIWTYFALKKQSNF